MRTSAAVLALAASIATLGAATRYVNVASTNAVAPFLSWATAASGIQSAVATASDGDTVLVARGVYRMGEEFWGEGKTRLLVQKPITVISVDGPQATVIEGDTNSRIRCVTLQNGAVLSGFTLTNGYGDYGGGAHSSAVITNCIIIGNQARQDGRGTLWRQRVQLHHRGQPGRGRGRRRLQF